MRRKLVIVVAATVGFVAASSTAAQERDLTESGNPLNHTRLVGDRMLVRLLQVQQGDGSSETYAIPETGITSKVLGWHCKAVRSDVRMAVLDCRMGSARVVAFASCEDQESDEGALSLGSIRTDDVRLLQVRCAVTAPGGNGPRRPGG